MIDIHSHILPTIDDGSYSMEESIKMAKQAEEIGVGKIIATPHFIDGEYETPIEKIVDIKEQLQRELNKRKIDVEILLGNEVYFDINILEHLQKEKIFTISDSKYLLVELPMMDIPFGLEKVLYELLAEGYEIIIAHPERNYRFQNDFQLIERLHENGMYFQLNIGSFFGYYGKKAKHIFKKILANNLGHIVSFDAHSANVYKVNIYKFINYIGQDNYKLLTNINPNKLLKDESLLNTDFKVSRRSNENLFLKIMRIFTS